MRFGGVFAQFWKSKVPTLVFEPVFFLTRVAFVNLVELKLYKRIFSIGIFFSFLFYLGRGGGEVGIGRLLLNPYGKCFFNSK